jgi:hypothetical protein
MKKPLAVGSLLFLFSQLPLFAEQQPVTNVLHSPIPVEKKKCVPMNASCPSDNKQPCAANSQESCAIPCSLPMDSRIQIGGNYTWVSIHPHEHNSFHGSLGGAQGIYEYRPMNRFYGGVKLAWREGETRGHSGKRSLIYVDTQERLGYTFSTCNNDFSLSLYAGFGYRYFGQKLDPKGGSSIKFRYNEIYIPVGFLADYAASSCFTIGAGFTWMPQIYPTVTIVPLKGARWIITDKLANFYVEMPLTFTLTQDKRFSLIINPFYEYWQDGHSTAKTSDGTKLGIPGNTYNFAGVDVNFAYSF